MIDAFIYFYQLDKAYNIPVTPESLPNTYQSNFTMEDIMNRTASKVTFSGTKSRVASVSLVIHKQLFILDNEEDTVEDLIKALMACSYPNFDAKSSKVVPPKVIIKFGNASTVRGVISSAVQVTLKEPWLKDGTLALAEINFTITELDQYSADYIAQFGANVQLPVDFKRR